MTFNIRHPLFEGEAGNGGGNGGGSTLLSSMGQNQQQQQAEPAPKQNGTDGDGNAVAFNFSALLDDKGGFRPDWHNTLPDDFKEFSGALAKYNNPLDAFRALGHSQKLIGQRQQAGKPPGPDAKPEDIAAWRKNIGVPDAPEGYGFKAPEKMPEGVKWDDKEAGEFAKFAHNIGLTPEQANKLVEWDMGQKATMFTNGRAKIDAHLQSQRQELDSKWGDKAREKTEAALKAAALLGLDPNDPDIGNSAKVIFALEAASKLFSEDKLVGSDKSGSGMTNKQMADDILNNPNNPWHKALWGKEGDARQREAQQQRNNLLGIKY